MADKQRQPENAALDTQVQRKNKVRPQNRHLKPFPKGVSGNPGGRPKGSINIWARIQRELNERITKGDHAGQQFADIVAKAFVKECVKGKWPQQQELINREEGKIPDRVAGADGKALVIMHLRGVKMKDL